MSAARTGQDRGPPSRRPVLFAAAVGVVLAVAKGAIIRSHSLGVPETGILMAALVVAAVTVGTLGSREGVLAVAGLRVRGPWRSAVPPVLLALVAGLAVAVGASGAGPPEALRIVLATGLGEEILFRGVVYGLAARAGTRAAVVVSSATFGVWHLVDGFEAAGAGWPVIGSVALAAGIVLVTGLAGAFLFAPLRRRTGSVYAPALLHAALNLAGTQVTGS